MPKKRRVTLEMISRELNISISSVSRALRNDPLVHPETRAQVNLLATRLGYQGRSRRGPQTDSGQKTIRAVFAAHSLTDIKAYVNMMAYIQGMTSEAEATQCILSIHATSPSGPQLEEPDFHRTLNALHADALILVGQHDPAFVEKLARQHPLITIVHTYPNIEHDLVSPDNVSGIMKLVKKLVALGHQKLAWINQDDDWNHTHMRRAGFLEACTTAGLPLDQQEMISNFSEKSTENGSELIRRALKKGVTAIVSNSDHLAYTVWKELSSNGIQVPRDMSLTGFDAVGEPRQECPSFTSIDPRFVEIGRAAIRMVLWRLSNSSMPPLQVTVGGLLFEGETIAPPTRQ